MRTFVILGMLILSYIPLRATDIKTYREWFRADASDFQRVARESYIKGIGEAGMSWANAQLIVLRHEPIYCVPKKLALGWANYKDILDQQIVEEAKHRTAEELDKQEIEALLLFGLIETFPCEGKK